MKILIDDAAFVRDELSQGRHGVLLQTSDKILNDKAQVLWLMQEVPAKACNVYAFCGLRDDPDILSTAFEHVCRTGTIQLLAPHIMQDPSWMLKAVHFNSMIFDHLPMSLRASLEFNLACATEMPQFLKLNIEPCIWNDEKFVMGYLLRTPGPGDTGTSVWLDFVAYFLKRTDAPWHPTLLKLHNTSSAEGFVPALRRWRLEQRLGGKEEQTRQIKI